MVLAGLLWMSCLVYWNDVIIIGKTFMEHLQNLRAVFERFWVTGLNHGKCRFCAHRWVLCVTEYLLMECRPIPPSREGCIVANTDIQVGGSTVPWAANYYQRFLRDFASIAKPLHHLTEKAARFEWTNECLATSRSTATGSQHPHVFAGFNQPFHPVSQV